MKKKSSPLSLILSSVFSIYLIISIFGNGKFSFSNIFIILFIVIPLISRIKRHTSGESEEKELVNVEKNKNAGAEKEARQYEHQNKQEVKEEKMFRQTLAEKEDHEVSDQEDLRPAATRFCPHCDEQLKKNYRKCPSCGGKL